MGLEVTAMLVGIEGAVDVALGCAGAPWQAPNSRPNASTNARMKYLRISFSPSIVYCKPVNLKTGLTELEGIIPQIYVEVGALKVTGKRPRLPTSCFFDEKTYNSRIWDNFRQVYALTERLGKDWYF
jgi:hypothetical protein